MPSNSRKVFIDSSVFLAFIDRSDINHAKSSKIFEDLARLNYQIYTSAQNISESYSALMREVGVAVALEFLQTVLESDIEVIYPQKADLISTNRILRSNRDKQLSFREALNSTLMQKRGIVQVITFSYWHNLYGTSISQLSLA